MEEKCENTNNDAKADYWKKQISNWQSSSLSQIAFCKQHNLIYSTFSYWRSKFLAESNKQNTNNFIPLKMSQAQRERSYHPIRIKLQSGVTIEIPSQYSMQQIQSIFKILDI